MPVIALTTPTGSPRPRGAAPARCAARSNVSMSSRLRLGEPLRVEPDRRHRLADRDAVASRTSSRCSAAIAPDDRARAPEVASRGSGAASSSQSEPTSSVRRGRPNCSLQGPHGDDRRDDAERAVVAPAGRLRVDVRPGRDHRPGLRSLRAVPQTLPTASRRTSSPASAIQAATWSWAATHSGEYTVRQTPVSPYAPWRASSTEEPLDEARVDVDRASSSAAPRRRASARRSRRAASSGSRGRRTRTASRPRSPPCRRPR